MQMPANTLLLWLLLAASTPAMGGVTCPAIPEPPVLTADDRAFQVAWQGVAEPYRARDAVARGEEPDYGVGYLGTDEGDPHYYDWLRQVRLPLWSAPQAPMLMGWLQGGRVQLSPGGQSDPLTGAGLVETAYENSALIVYEARDDGWLRIRLKPGAAGEAWTHRCHLGIGGARLAYAGWESFLSGHGDWLHFRARVPHVLRAGPGIDSPRITLIGLDHKLELQEIRGDWMRVRVEQPDRTCGDAERPPDSVHQGWVRWRDGKQGPWVWVYTRGC